MFIVDKNRIACMISYIIAKNWIRFFDNFKNRIVRFSKKQAFIFPLRIFREHPIGK